MSKPNKRDASRAGKPDPFDFNSKPVPVSEYAAGAVTRDALRTLFKRLDAADEAWGDTATSRRIAAFDALKAVTSFLDENAANSTKRFSRPLKLLERALEKYRDAPGEHLLPPAGRGQSGGVNSNPETQHVKAAAVFALEFLCEHGGFKGRMNDAALEIGDRLHRRGFRFSTRRDGRKTNIIKKLRRKNNTDTEGAEDNVRDSKRAARAQQVLTWRREYYHPIANPPSYATEYKKLRADPPVKPEEELELRGLPPQKIVYELAENSARVLAWFEAEVARAGYGAVVPDAT